MRILIIAGLLVVLGCGTGDECQVPPAVEQVEIDAKQPHLPNTKIDVLGYMVELRFAEFGATTIPAQVGVHAKLLVPSEDLRLHINSELMSFTQVTVDGHDVEFEIVDGMDGAEDFGLKGDVLRVELGEERVAGSVVNVDLTYEIDGAGMDGDRGVMYRDDHGDPIFVTRNWPYYARFWLPSNDHPGDIATLDAVIEVPADGQAAANGSLLEGTYEEGSGVNSDGYRVFRWSQRTPIPTYAINISVGRFEIEEAEYCYDPESPGSARVDCTEETPGISYAYFLRPNLPEKDAFRGAAQSGIDSAILFSKLLGEYPYEKLGFVTAPHPFSMEAVSLIIMTGPGATVHEVLHHWWGDTVYIKHWGDFWISEGFTTYFTGLYDELVTGENTSCLIETASGEMRATLEEGVLNNPEDTDPMTVFDGVPYCRGASALHALRSTMADLAGVPEDREKSLELFLDLSRGIYQEYRFELLGSQELTGFLKRELPALLVGVARSDIERAVDEWQAEWLPDESP